MKERRPTRESFLKWKNTRKAKKNFPSMTDPELAWAYLCHFYKHGQLATHFCCAWPRVANRWCKKRCGPDGIKDCWGKRTKEEREVLIKVLGMVRTFGKYQDFYRPVRRNRIEMVLEDLQDTTGS